MANLNYEVNHTISAADTIWSDVLADYKEKRK